MSGERWIPCNGASRLVFEHSHLLFTGKGAEPEGENETGVREVHEVLAKRGRDADLPGLADRRRRSRVCQVPPGDRDRHGVASVALHRLPS